MSEPLYLDLFDQKSDIAMEFGGYEHGATDSNEATEDEINAELADAEILVALYEYEDYQGHAWVLYCKDGKLYEVNGGHCSCYGLEGQWSPEETTVAALKMRKWGDASDDESKQIAAVIEAL